MPIFEYQCKDCGYRFEKIVFRRDQAISCPNCGGGQTEKLLSSFALGNSGGSSSAGAGSSCGPGRFT